MGCDTRDALPSYEQLVRDNDDMARRLTTLARERVELLSQAAQLRVAVDDLMANVENRIQARSMALTREVGKLKECLRKQRGIHTRDVAIVSLAWLGAFLAYRLGPL